MRNFCRWLTLLVLVFAGAVLLARGPRDGLTSANQVILWSESSRIGPVYYPFGAAPDDPVRATAEDIGRILGLMSGQEWPVAPESRARVEAEGIFIGDTLRARLDGVSGARDGRPVTAESPRQLLHSDSWEGATALIHPRRLVIQGVTTGATRAAVYRFLQEELGCFWAQPGSAGERLPRLERCALREGRRHYQPGYEDRQFLLGGKLEPSQAEGLWAIRNGASRYFEFNHHLFRIFTPAVMVEHETWRAWRFGQRVPVGDVRGSGAQPDLLNPEVAAYAAGAIGQSLRADPDRLSYSLGTNDSIRYDDSAATRAVVTPFQYHRGKPVYSDLVFGFMNAVVEQLPPPLAYGEAPLMLTQLAYMWTEPPPRFAVPPNVTPYLCSDQSQWYDPAYRAEDLAMMDAWCDAGPRRLGAWVYEMGEPYLIPRYFPTLLSEYLNALYERKGRGVFFSGRAVWGFDAPKYWLAAQQAWRPDANHEALLADYFKRAYGAASQPMADFFAQCEQAWLDQPGEGMWLKYWDNPDQFSLFSPSRREEMSSLLENAVAQAEAMPAGEDRASILTMIEETRKAWAVTDAGAALYDAWHSLPYPKRPGEAPPPSAERIEVFHQALEQWGRVDKAPFQRTDRFIGIMNRLDPLERWSASWPSVLKETFQEPIFEGDMQGGGPDTIHPERMRRGWAAMISHAEDASVRRFEGPDARLRISGVDYGNVYRWLEVQPGLAGQFRLEVALRGAISAGAQVEINLYFMDAKRQSPEPIRFDRLSPGDYPEWVTLATTAPIPPGATHVCVGVRSSDFYPGDWIEVRSMDLQYRAPHEAVSELGADRTESFQLAPMLASRLGTLP